MCCEFWDFVEKLLTTFEEIHILVHSFTDGVCSKLATIENEATAFEVIESQEKKEEKLLGTRSIHRLGGWVEKGEFHLVVRDLIFFLIVSHVNVNI